MSVFAAAVAVALGVVMAGLVWPNLRLLAVLVFFLAIVGTFGFFGILAYDEWGVPGAVIVAKAGIVGAAQFYDSFRRR